MHLTHGAALYYVLTALSEDAVAVLVREFSASVVLDAMQRHSATTLFGLPFMCFGLAEEQAARPRDLPALRHATVAGDTCPTEVTSAWAASFGLPLVSFWAAAEDVGATIVASRVGPFMRVIPSASTRAIDASGTTVPDGSPGELVVRSPTTSPGYWPLVAGSTGAFRTGDLVRWTAPDELEYLGRQKDLIIRGGSNVSPVEVEARLREDPLVVRTALPLGRRGRRWDSGAKACSSRREPVNSLGFLAPGEQVFDTMGR